MRSDPGRKRDAAGAPGVTHFAVSGTASPPDHLRVAAANGDTNALAELLRRAPA